MRQPTDALALDNAAHHSTCSLSDRILVDAALHALLGLLPVGRSLFRCKWVGCAVRSTRRVRTLTADLVEAVRLMLVVHEELMCESEAGLTSATDHPRGFLLYLRRLSQQAPRTTSVSRLIRAFTALRRETVSRTSIRVETNGWIRELHAASTTLLHNTGLYRELRPRQARMV